MERTWIRPDLTRPRAQIARQRRKISPRRRFTGISKVVVKQGLRYIVLPKGKTEEERQRAVGRWLRECFEELGPTFIKFGQVLMTRQELLPDSIADELAQLLSEVPSMPFEFMATVLEDELPDGLSTLRWIDETPIGSASLAQVYHAQMHDGREVAIKVLRPNIDKLFDADIKLIRKIAHQLQRLLPPERAESLDLLGSLKDYYSSAENELNMEYEAYFMSVARDLVRDQATLRVPDAYFASKHVLVMEYIDGWNIKEFPVDLFTFEERMERMVDLAHFYIKAFLDGMYHADPHGSNIMIDRHTREAVVLDWGMVGRMDALHTESIFRMLMHMRLNQAEDATEVAVDIFTPTKYTNRIQLRDQMRSLFIYYVDSNQGSDYNWGNLTFSLIKIAVDNHCRIPNGLALWAKGWSAAEGTARWICPEISYHSVVETAAVQIMRSWMGRRFNYQANASLLAETAKLVGTLPRRLNKILEHLAWNNLDFSLEARVSKGMIVTARRLINRLVTAVLAGLAFLGGTDLLTRHPPGISSSAAHTLNTIGYIALWVSAVLGAWTILQLLRRNHTT